MAELSVKIGADIKELQSKLKQTEKSLKHTEKASIKAGKSIGKVGANASSGINKLNKSTLNATPAVQEFSRVIQDAPYGIQGVANNIQQLTSQFGYLSTKAGGAKGALKAMIGSLAGPAGILLAVSAVTAGMVAYGDEIKNWISQMTRGKDAVIKMTEAEKEAKEEREKVISKIKEEQTELTKLVGNITSVNTSEGRRSELISELIKKYPVFLNSLSEESLTNEGLKTRLAEVNKLYIIRIALQSQQKTIEEAFSKVGEKQLGLAKKQLITEEGLLAIATKINKDRATQNRSKQISLENKTYEQQVSIIKSALETERTYFSQVSSKEGKYQDAYKRRLAIRQKELNLVREAEKSNNSLSATIDGENRKLEEQQDILTKLEAKFKITAEQINDLFKGADNEVVIKASSKEVDAQKEVNDKKRALLESFIKENSERNKVAIDEWVNDWENAGLNTTPTILKAKAEVDIEGFKEKLKQGQLVASQFSSAASGAFSSLSQSISGSLETGNKLVDGFVGSIVSSLGSLLSELASSAVKQIAINQATATSSAIAGGASSGAATGAGALFAMPVMIASLVALVGSAFGGLSSFAKGGFSGDDNLAYLNKNELVLRPMEQAALYNAIRGNSLGGLSSRVSPNTAGQTMQVFGKISGGDILLSNKRSNRRNDRFYN